MATSDEMKGHRLTFLGSVIGAVATLLAAMLGLYAAYVGLGGEKRVDFFQRTGEVGAVDARPSPPQTPSATPAEFAAESGAKSARGNPNPPPVEAEVARPKRPAEEMVDLILTMQPLLKNGPTVFEARRGDGKHGAWAWNPTPSRTGDCKIVDFNSRLMGICIFAFDSDVQEEASVLWSHLDNHMRDVLRFPEHDYEATPNHSYRRVTFGQSEGEIFEWAIDVVIQNSTNGREVLVQFWPRGQDIHRST